MSAFAALALRAAAFGAARFATFVAPLFDARFCFAIMYFPASACTEQRRTQPAKLTAVRRIGNSLDVLSTPTLCNPETQDCVARSEPDRPLRCRSGLHIQLLCAKGQHGNNLNLHIRHPAVMIRGSNCITTGKRCTPYFLQPNRSKQRSPNETAIATSV